MKIQVTTILVSPKPKHPESYYERGLALIAAERRAYRAMQKDRTKTPAWVRAAARLSAHESAF